MDWKALLASALKSSEIRAIVTPVLQGMAVVALTELTNQVKQNPALIGKLLDEVAKIANPT